MSDDPWWGIDASAQYLTGRRIAQVHALDIYWVKAADGSPGLLVRGLDPSRIPYQLPKPRGMILEAASGADGSEARMFLREQGDRDVFRTLCQDVITYSASETSRCGATNALFRRLMHWHSLMSRGRATTMAVNEVRGLIGELYVLERITERSGFERALDSWVAPDDHPQDFTLASRIVEVKARLAGSRRHVQVSSLEQLDSAHLPLSLAVVELVHSDMDDSFSLNGICGRLAEVAKEQGVAVEDAFHAALLRRGYLKQEAYDADTYKVTGMVAFDVVGCFPRLRRQDVDVRIPQVRYTLDLAQLQEFEVSISDLLG